MRWRPSTTIKASVALHAAAGAAVLAAPGLWPPALAVVLANQALLTAAGLLPRSALLGPNLTRLPEASATRGAVALTIDDGPDPEVTPRVLDLLDTAGMKATFFCIGERVATNPALAREMVGRGHAIENHSQHHLKLFAALGPGGMRREIVDAQKSIADAVGRAPRWFRPTAGLRNPFLDPVLAGLDLRLASWTRRPFDTRCGDADTVHARLTRNLAAGDILLMHDGHAARTPAGAPVILEALPRLLDHLRQCQLHSVTLDAALGQWGDGRAGDAASNAVAA
jgi:peptidoglycan/xylan/chitin deacetylase (PgdA/CDA1 family)